jgi:2'-5' RNA ligase
MALPLPDDRRPAAPRESGDGPWRCFLAWLPPESVLDELERLVRELARNLPASRLRWLPRPSLHLTLRFLGDCDADARSRLSAFLRGLPVAAAIPARVPGIQYLPSSRDARVLVLRVESGGVLERFAATLEAAIRAEGFAPEPRAFRAHITLARTRPGPERLLPFTEPPPQIALVVDHVALMRSHLGGGPAEYHELQRIGLTQP